MSATTAAAAAPDDLPVLDPLADPHSAERFRSKLVWLAWSRYRVTRDEAEDIVQTAFTAYLQVRERYAHVADHGAILGGIFRNKCLTHITRAGREQRRLERYCTTPDAARENPWIRPTCPAQAPSVVDELVNRETRREIRKAFAHLKPSSRRLLTLLVLQGLGRRNLIQRMGLNKNTFDSRLHACRAELRRLLRGGDVSSCRPRTAGSRTAASGATRRAALRSVPLRVVAHQV